MSILTVKKEKKVGTPWVTPAFEIKSCVGTTTVYFSVEFRKGFTDLSVGIQSYSDENWEVPRGYSFFVEGFEHDLANPDFNGKRELNIVHPQLNTNSNVDTFKAILKTPSGDIKFVGFINKTHRKQYVTVETSLIPSDVQVTETVI